MQDLFNGIFVKGETPDTFKRNLQSVYVDGLISVFAEDSTGVAHILEHTTLCGSSDEINDPHNLNLRTYVNDEERQNTNTSLMIYDCFTLIEYLSTAFTLNPGDLIPTGTPEGSALATQNWLVPGDRVKVEIDGIGFIENEIVQEPDTTKTLF